jgi:hypothetical protein
MVSQYSRKLASSQSVHIKVKFPIVYLPTTDRPHVAWRRFQRRTSTSSSSAAARIGQVAEPGKKILRGQVRAVRGVQNVSAVREGLLRKCLFDECG